MSNAIKGKTAIKVMGIDAAVRNKCYLNSLTAVCNKDGCHYVINGKLECAKKVEALYPTDTKPKLIKGKNNDGRAVY